LETREIYTDDKEKMEDLKGIILEK
jgi:hypothetical protein